MRRENRMNISGRPEGNSYGTKDMLSDGDFEWLRDLTSNWNRSRTLLSPHTVKRLEAISRPCKQLSYWPTAWNILCGQEAWDDFIH